LSCISGLLTIHLTGLAYLILLHIFNWASTEVMTLQQAALSYSVYPLSGQIAVVCAVTVLAYGLRHVLFIN